MSNAEPVMDEQQPDASRVPWLTRPGTIVVKVGTNVLTGDRDDLDHRRVDQLAAQLARLHDAGRRVVLVSSGAIGAGVGALRLPRRPTDLPRLQACAAVGQTRLIQAYQEALAPRGLLAAQILLTASDFETRVRYLNARNTIRTLLEYGTLPVINENDTVSVAEIKFGDNDHLAALVAGLLEAPLLILLTNVDGLYSADPRLDARAQLVSTVPAITAEVKRLAADTRSRLGTGGMRSKLRAAEAATLAGTAVIMANGAMPGVLDRLFAGETLGTLFVPRADAASAWKRWLGGVARSRGLLTLDEGACRAVVEQGRSLLPVGVVAVSGEFAKGDVVTLCDALGQVIARGLTNYSATEARRVIGRPSDTGARPGNYHEIVHRDHLVCVSDPARFG